jgi:hypothetical protein
VHRLLRAPDEREIPHHNHFGPDRSLASNHGSDRSGLGLLGRWVLGRTHLPLQRRWYTRPIRGLWSPADIRIVIFTVANLIITDAFSSNTQALAGAVFNTTAQFGFSLGLMVMAVTSSRVTANSPYKDKESPEALMSGYRAVFWLCFGMQLFACVVSIWGLRGIGKVGLKRD